MERAGRKTFPIVFATALVAASVAFANRRYFLRNIGEEVNELNKSDPDFKAMYDKTIKELNR